MRQQTVSGNAIGLYDFCTFLVQHDFIPVYSPKDLEVERTYHVQYGQSTVAVLYTFRNTIHVENFSLPRRDYEGDGRNAFVGDR